MTIKIVKPESMSFSLALTVAERYCKKNTKVQEVEGYFGQRDFMFRVEPTKGKYPTRMRFDDISFEYWVSCRVTRTQTIFKISYA